MDEMTGFPPLTSLLDLTHDQLKDGRRLARLTTEELARRVGVSRRNIVKIEGSEHGIESAAFGTIRSIVRELTQEGVQFLPDGTVARKSGPSGSDLPDARA